MMNSAGRPTPGTAAPPEAALFSASTVKHGNLRKKASSGVLTAGSFQPRYFVLTANGALSYWRTKEDWEAGVKPNNDAPFMVSQCVVKFDMGQGDASRKHGILITPKSKSGGARELQLEAGSTADRDQWRSWIRGAVAFVQQQAGGGNNGPAAASAASTGAASAVLRSSNEFFRSEASTDLGRLLSDCRLDDFTHGFVAVEGFSSCQALVE